MSKCKSIENAQTQYAVNQCMQCIWLTVKCYNRSYERQWQNYSGDYNEALNAVMIVTN